MIMMFVAGSSDKPFYTVLMHAFQNRYWDVLPDDDPAKKMMYYYFNLLEEVIPFSWGESLTYFGIDDTAFYAAHDGIDRLKIEIAKKVCKLVEEREPDFYREITEKVKQILWTCDVALSDAVDSIESLKPVSEEKTEPNTDRKPAAEADDDSVPF